MGENASRQQRMNMPVLELCSIQPVADATDLTQKQKAINNGDSAE
jgi:hypothetical protein